LHGVLIGSFRPEGCIFEIAIKFYGEFELRQGFAKPFFAIKLFAKQVVTFGDFLPGFWVSGSDFQDSVK